MHGIIKSLKMSTMLNQPTSITMFCTAYYMARLGAEMDRKKGVHGRHSHMTKLLGIVQSLSQSRRIATQPKIRRNESSTRTIARASNIQSISVYPTA